MCSPGIQLTDTERYNLKNGDRLMAYLLSDKATKDVVICGWNSKFNSPQMNMRRLEKIANPPEGIIHRAATLVKPEQPAIYTMEEPVVFPSFNGFWERRKPDIGIMVPEGFRIAGLVDTRMGVGRLVTVGPAFVNALKKVSPKTPSLKYYATTFTCHGKNPRAPLIVKSSITPRYTRLCGVMCEIA